MTIRELDIGEDTKYMTIRRTTFYGLVIALVLLVVIFTFASFFAYSAVVTPKTFCGYITEYKVGDQDAQDGCYYKLAKEYSDIEFCNGILNKDLQKECARIVEQTM